MSWAERIRQDRDQAAAELAEHARAEERAAISELAAVYLLQTRPTDRALAGWGVFGDSEPNRGPAIVHHAAQVSAARIIEDAMEYAP